MTPARTVAIRRNRLLNLLLLSQLALFWNSVVAPCHQNYWRSFGVSHALGSTTWTRPQAWQVTAIAASAGSPGAGLGARPCTRSPVTGQR